MSITAPTFGTPEYYASLETAIERVHTSARPRRTVSTRAHIALTIATAAVAVPLMLLTLLVALGYATVDEVLALPGDFIAWLTGLFAQPVTPSIPKVGMPS